MPKNDKTKTQYDFSGYATKNDLKCSDGRTIIKDAFKHQDGATVPLVWRHMHNEPDNILGHAVLENRAEGVYCYGKFNDSEKGKTAKELVSHGDISALSIYANDLKEQSKKVSHGAIREVSLVLSGANPGALIDNIAFAHEDGSTTVDDSEAIIYTGLNFNDDATAAHSDIPSIEDVFNTFNEDQKAVLYTMLAHASTGKQTDVKPALQLQHAAKKTEPTVKDVFDTLSEDQKKVVYYMIGAAVDENTASTNTGDTAGKTGPVKHTNINNKGDLIMKNNVFDKGTKNEDEKNVLTHDQMAAIIKDVSKYGGSLKESFIAHAEEYGFNPIDILFPDAKDVLSGGPDTLSRKNAWVASVLADTNHTPFSRIRTRIADLTPDEARAKGYITGNLKLEEVITLTKRVTTPTTIYKKQKLDRDDVLDITDFDVVVWLKAEMRGMLDEEIARAVLLGDGRSPADESKINEQNVRPIALDNDNMFVVRVIVPGNETTDAIIDDFIRARKFYKGSGVPSLYISTDLLTEMLLLKDTTGHRLYATVQELASVLRVSEIIEVEPMNEAVRMVGDVAHKILGIVVNLKDYTIGADKGGQVSMFDNFDIDYNQQKYLIETRISGALTRPKSAIVVESLPVAP
jgi:hypothetical protein